MVNICEVDSNDKMFYRSAYDFCMGLIAKNDMLIKDAIEETMKFMGVQVSDSKKLNDYLFEQISMEYDRESFLVGPEVKDVIWWQDHKKTIESQFWTRYYNYLIQKGWDRGAIDIGIDNTTDKVLNAMANPLLNIEEERKGVVVGYVQSGKTAHYIGLINKAVDAGYKIIIVLAGMHNNLRSQTQSRIDEEVLGFETSTKYLSEQVELIKNEIGVGVGARSKTDFYVQPLTSRDENGDFNKAKSRISFIPQNPILLVVKKQVSVLKNLIENFKNNHIASVNFEKNTVHITPNYPLLIIDDEADQASINTNYAFDENGNIRSEYDPSTINRLIRVLFKLFDCRSYVGYTATPYANIFIPDKAYDDQYGSDLFPKDFILSLSKPNKYIGAVEFFGSEYNPGMPLYREVKDLAFIDSKKKVVRSELPKELEKAIMSFVISTATRNCRGEKGKPNTMLIHITRLTDIQKLVHRKVKAYYEDIMCQIKGGDTEIWDKLHDIWINDYEKTTSTMLQEHKKYMDNIKKIEWKDISGEIKNIMCDNMIKVYSINGKSKDALLYKDHKSKQYNVIAIGGDKLSRGLTLEGLTISYFTRESKMYDTLMQMGRWFGFRPGYADLCRIYTQKNLFLWFQEISFATEDLRNQIDYMNNIEETPENFGLRVATHPGLKISNEKKIKSGDDRRMSFSNTLNQTRAIDINAEKYRINFVATENFIKSLGKNVEHYWEKKGRLKSTNSHLFWENVNGNYIADFLLEYETSKNANKANSKYMAEYIQSQMKVGGLTNWTVCLINVGKNKELKIADLTIGKGITRTEKGFDKVGDICAIRTLTSKDQEYYDFTQTQMDNVRKMQAAKEKNKGKTTSEFIRAKIRNRLNGLIIIYPINVEEVKDLKIEGEIIKTPIGFAIVFPDNEKLGDLVSYKLNAVGVRGDGNELY